MSIKVTCNFCGATSEGGGMSTANPFDVPEDITDYSHDEAYERGVNAGIAWSAGRFLEHRGEDQSVCPCPACEHYELVNARAAESDEHKAAFEAMFPGTLDALEGLTIRTTDGAAS